MLCLFNVTKHGEITQNSRKLLTKVCFAVIMIKPHVAGKGILCPFPG